MVKLKKVSYCNLETYWVKQVRFVWDDLFSWTRVVRVKYYIFKNKCDYSAISKIFPKFQSKVPIVSNIRRITILRIGQILATFTLQVLGKIPLIRERLKIMLWGWVKKLGIKSGPHVNLFIILFYKFAENSYNLRR